MQNPTDQAETSIPTTETAAASSVSTEATTTIAASTATVPVAAAEAEVETVAEAATIEAAAEPAINVNVNRPSNVFVALVRKVAKRTESWYNRSPPPPLPLPSPPQTQTQNLAIAAPEEPPTPTPTPSPPQNIAIVAPVEPPPPPPPTPTPPQNLAILAPVEPSPLPLEISPVSSRRSPRVSRPKSARSEDKIPASGKKARRGEPEDKTPAGGKKARRGEPEDKTPASRKKARRREPPPTTRTKRRTTTTDKAPPTAAADHDDSNAGANRARRWTVEENAMLTRAVTNTPKVKHGKVYRIDWQAVAALVPGRGLKMCKLKWYHEEDLIAEANQATGCWTAEEDAMLTRAVTNTPKTMHGKVYRIDWHAVAALVPSRGRKQCNIRWHRGLDANVDQTPRRTSIWTEDEVNRLKDVVETLGENNWIAIAALLPGRAKSQCKQRWNVVLEGYANADAGAPLAANRRWTSEEDYKLNSAVTYTRKVKHGEEYRVDWVAVAALVPDRTKKQCLSRWKTLLDADATIINGTTGQSSGKWTSAEDIKLTEAVQIHGGRNWGAISTLVPGRTRRQCNKRWERMQKPNSPS